MKYIKETIKTRVMMKIENYKSKKKKKKDF